MAERTYPADPSDAALRLFLRWLGATYARSATVERASSADEGLVAEVRVGRQWLLQVAVLNTLAPETDAPFEMARAALERRLDDDGRSFAVWLPRGAPLPTDEPALSEFVAAAANPTVLDDGRLEVRRPVTLHLRRTATQGSVITVLGGLSGHWAQFTNRVPGSFQLNSLRLHRLPASPEERHALAERIVLAAGQPDIDDSLPIGAEDAWTANDLVTGGSCILGSPAAGTDEQSATLRRNLRRLLRDARATPTADADATALVVLGAATYAEEEKLSWALRGMDPALYAGYDLLAVLADGVVKPLLQPGRQTLPWDAPLA